MTIEAYLHAMQERFVTDPIVTSFHVIRERSTLVDGHLRAQLALADWVARFLAKTPQSRSLMSLLGLDHRVGHFWPLRMTSNSSNAHFFKRLGSFS